MENEVINALYKKFDNVSTRAGRGGNYQYLRWQDVADRMNRVFGINWSSKVKSQEIIDNNIVVRVEVTVTDPSTGQTYSHEGYGGSPNDEWQEAGNPFKAAYSKALKAAVRLWGVGLYIEEEEWSKAPSPPPEGFMGKETGVPSSAPMGSPSPAMAPPVSATPMTAPTGGGGMAMPAGVSMREMSTPAPVKTSVAISQEAPAVANSPEELFSTARTMTTPVTTVMPATPAPTQTPPVATPVENSPLNKTQAINMGGTETISDVQKAALNSILSMQEVEYEALVQEAFEANNIVKDSVPEMGKLTYDEAVLVVKYGNAKWRKR